MATTKAAIRLRAARRLGLVDTITTTSAGHADGHTFVATGLLDNFPTSLSEMWVYDPDQEESRRIINYDEPEGIAFVNRPFTAQINSADTLYIFRRFSPAAFDQALEQAVEDVYPYLFQRIVDTSLTTAAETYEYTIPASIRDLERMLGGKVEMQVRTDDADYPYVPLRMWETREAVTTASSSYTLVIHPDELVAGRTLRLRGIAPLAYPAGEADTVPVDAPQVNLLVFMVIANLYATTYGAPEGDSNRASGIEGRYRTLFETMRDQWGMTLDPEDIRPPIDGFDRDLPLAYNSTP